MGGFFDGQTQWDWDSQELCGVDMPIGVQLKHRLILFRSGKLKVVLRSETSCTWKQLGLKIVCGTINLTRLG